MKKIKIYFILLMLFGFSSVFAQVTRSDNTPDTKSLADPKFSSEEHERIRLAGENNPAKIDGSSMADPKINPEDLATEEDYGVSNSKPAVNAVDPKLESGQVAKVKDAEPEPSSKAVSGGNQPAGANGGTVPDYRKVSAGGNDQPLGEEPKNIQDYRELQGSGNQPPGNTPYK